MMHLELCPVSEIPYTMSIEKVVIIIPTYNESLVIEETITKIFHMTAGIPSMDIHVLVFDSASTDNTQQIITTLQTTYKNLHLKTEAKKSGLGSAYLQAMRHALNELAADIVMEFDADLSHQPQYIAPILAKLSACDVVVGSRYVSGGTIPKEWGWHRKLLSVLGNYVARALLTRKYKDFTSGFRATRKSALEKVLPKKFLSNHYAYKLELLWLLHKSKARICEYPIEFVDRQKGQSKLPTNSILDSLTVVSILRFNELKVYFKMCLVGLSGVVVQCLVYNVLR
jgi:dolichol-phosphate mannosyltransferase